MADVVSLVQNLTDGRYREFNEVMMDLPARVRSEVRPDSVWIARRGTTLVRIVPPVAVPLRDTIEETSREARRALLDCCLAEHRALMTEDEGGEAYDAFLASATALQDALRKAVACASYDSAVNQLATRAALSALRRRYERLVSDRADTISRIAVEDDGAVREREKLERELSAIRAQIADLRAVDVRHVILNPPSVRDDRDDPERRKAATRQTKRVKARLGRRTDDALLRSGKPA